MERFKLYSKYGLFSFISYLISLVIMYLILDLLREISHDDESPAFVIGIIVVLFTVGYVIYHLLLNKLVNWKSNQDELYMILDKSLLYITIFTIFIAFLLIFIEVISDTYVEHLKTFAPILGFMIFPNVYLLITGNNKKETSEKRLLALEKSVHKIKKQHQEISNKEKIEDHVFHRQQKFIKELIAVSRGKDSVFREFISTNLHPKTSKLSMSEINENIEALKTMDDKQRIVVAALAEGLKESYEPAKLLTPVIAGFGLVFVVYRIINLANELPGKSLLVLVMFVGILYINKLTTKAFTTFPVAAYFTALLDNIKKEEK